MRRVVISEQQTVAPPQVQRRSNRLQAAANIAQKFIYKPITAGLDLALKAGEVPVKLEAGLIGQKLQGKPLNIAEAAKFATEQFRGGGNIPSQVYPILAQNIERAKANLQQAQAEFRKNPTPQNAKKLRVAVAQERVADVGGALNALTIESAGTFGNPAVIAAGYGFNTITPRARPISLGEASLGISGVPKKSKIEFAAPSPETRQIFSTPEKMRAGLKSSLDLNQYISYGFKPEDLMNAKGILKPEVATGRISDIAGKLEAFKPGLGQKFVDAIDPATVTLKKLETTAEQLIASGKIGRVVDVGEKVLAGTTSRRFYESIDTKPQVESIVQKTGRFIQEFPGKFQTAFIDKYDPIGRLDKRIQQVTGKKSDLKNRVQATFGKGAGIAEDKLDTYIGIRQSYGDDWKYVKEYSHYLDDLDRLKNGDTIAGGRNAEQVQADIQQLTSELGPEKSQVIYQGTRQLQTFLDQNLKDALAAGRISPEGYAAIKKAHPNYVPHDVLKYLDESAPSGLGQSINLSRSGIEGSTGGSTERIRDLDLAIVDQIYRQSVLNEKNKTLRAIIDVGRQSPEQLGFVPLRTEENVTRRIQLSQTAKSLVEKNNQQIDLVSFISKQEAKEAAGIRRISLSEPPARIQNLQSRIEKTGTEISTLMDEAQTRASEFEDLSTVNTILNRITIRESKIATLYERAQNLESAFNQKQAATIQERATAINLLKSQRRTLEQLINERASDIKQLRSEISSLSDVKLKRVDIPEGYEKVSYFKNGVREDWLVPQKVGEALKNLDGEQVSTIGQWLSTSTLGQAIQLPAKAIRGLATGYNPFFALFSNPVRDVQTAAITTNPSMIDYLKGLSASISGNFGRGNELYRQALKEGTFTSSIYRETRDPEKILQAKLNQSFGRTVMRPWEIVPKLGQTLEQSTRLAAFNKSLRSGLSLEEASKISRGSTVDFSRSGKYTQLMNRVVPFLNARIQGFDNLIRTAKKKPLQTTVATAVTVGIPSLLLHANNQRYQSYRNIPDYEKRKYWIVMVGEHDGFDTKGNPAVIPNYLKIPKGEGQQFLASIMQRVLERGQQRFPDSTGQFLAKLVGDVSPVNETSILPAGIQQGIELKLNRTFFQGQEIVPQYVRFNGVSFRSLELPAIFRYNSQTTSPIAVEIGQKIGVSPAQVDYLIKTGVLNDLTRLQKVQLDPNKPLFDNLANFPFLRTVLGNKITPQSTQVNQQIIQFKRRLNTYLLKALQKKGILQ